MKHLFYFFICLLSILNSVKGNDSLSILSISANSGSLIGVNITTLSNGNNLITGSHFEQGSDVSGLMTRIASDHVIWSTLIRISGQDVRITKAVEFSNGEIVVIGKSFKNLTPELSTPFVSKISAAGQVLWTRTIGEHLSPDPARSVIAGDVQEGRNGEVLVIASISSDFFGENGDHGLFLKLSASGNLLLNKLFVLPTGSLNRFVSLFYHKGDIVIFGNITDGQCSGLDLRAIYYLKLDYDDAKLIESKRFCFAGMPAANSYSFFNRNFRVEYRQNQFMLSGILADGKDHLIMHFDNNLTLIRSSYTMIPAINPSRVQIRLDDSGNLHAVGSKGSSSSYYFMFDRNGRVSQRYAQQLNMGTDYGFSESGENLTVESSAIAYFRNITSTGKNSIQLVRKQFRYAPANACSITDTNFSVTLKPFGLEESQQHFKSIEDNMVPTFLINIEQFAITLTIRKECEDVNVCKMVKLSGKDTICLNNNQVQLKIEKNKGCGDKIEWTVDTSIVSSISVETDSTVKVIFKQQTSRPTRTKLFVNLSNDNSIKDSLEVILFPAGNLSSKTLQICPGDTIQLGPGSWFKDYRWQDGSIDSTLQVSKAGSYSVNILDYCQDFHKVKIDIVEPPKLLSHLGPLSVCRGQSLTIVPNLAYSDFEWTASSSLTILPDYSAVVRTGEAETYHLKAKAFLSCNVRDSVSVIVNDVYSPEISGDSSICKGSSVMLRTNPNLSRYLWSNGSTSSQTEIFSSGSYWVSTVDKNNCKSSDSIIIADKNCQLGLYFPNSFTPNRDGRNDIFKPVLFGSLVKYELTIFNRFGEKVFQTNAYNIGWDGSYKSKPQSTGTFIWMSSFQLHGDLRQSRRGSIQLLR